ncbi:MAG: hypothetical protein CR975_07365, partial [Gammaproteobacteria bacterium]
SEILQAMRPIAEMMDSEKHRPHYVSIIERQIDVVNNPSLTPSARIMANLRGEVSGRPMTYHQFITELSRQQMQISRDLGLTYAEKAKVARDAQLSLEKEKFLLKKSQHLSFAEYLADYFAQLEGL